MSEQGSKPGGRNDRETEGFFAANLPTLLNLGPVTARRLQAVGLHTPVDLERIGSVEAFLRVEQEFPHDTTLVLLYALEGALQNVPWTALPKGVKADLRRRVVG
jgi:DNA transformation protein